MNNQEVGPKVSEFSAKENSGQELVEFLKKLGHAETKDPFLRYNGLMAEAPKFVVYETKVSNSFCDAWGAS